MRQRMQCYLNIPEARRKRSFIVLVNFSTEENKFFISAEKSLFVWKLEVEYINEQFRKNRKDVDKASLPHSLLFYVAEGHYPY